MFKILDGRDSFYQWDLDRKLIVDDASIKEVHFCNCVSSNALICETYTEDGATVVNVPNILLQDNWRIHVFAYDTNYTKFSTEYEVSARSKPADYIYTETELKTYSALEERIKELEAGAGVDLTGYATEDYVETAISNALGVIENGSY